MMDQSDQDFRHRLLIAHLPAMPQILIKLIEHLQADDLDMAQLAARDLACRIAYPHVEQAYLAALLHSIGRLALLAAAPQQYAVHFNARDDAALCAVEQRTLHMTHAEAGASLIERWNLDTLLADAVRHHHEPNAGLASVHLLTRIVRLAHLMASHPADAAALADAARLCGLPAHELGALGAACARETEKLAAQLGIDLAGADESAAAPAPVSAPALAPAPAPAPVSAPAPAPLDPLRQRLADEVRNLVLVSQAGHNFARQQGESALLESMTRSARMLFDFDNTVILLENPSGLALVGVPGTSAQNRAGWSIPLASGGAIAAAAREQRLAFIGRDVQLIKRAEEQPIGLAEEQLFVLLATDSLVCVPLVAGARCLGLLIGAVATWKMALCQQRARCMAAFGVQAGGTLAAARTKRGQPADVAEQYRKVSRQVVHEVNNALSIIKNYLSVLDDKLARREPVLGEMAILNEEIDRVSQLINGLAELPAGAPFNASTLSNAANLSTSSLSLTAGATDATRVVDDVLRLFCAPGFMPPEVHIVVSEHADGATIDADAATLKQILINLLKNAIEALGASGRIDIAHRGHVYRNGAVYVELAISDNGPGLAPEVLAGLFLAVRSSKDGAHRGLGLSIVQGLVNKLDGMISCRSGTGGTTFEILLPAHGGVSAGVIAGAQVPMPAPVQDAV